MEPLLQHPQVHRYGEDHHHQHFTNNSEGDDTEEQHHGEKKSVLKKVKVKAHKIKESIKEHVHLHGHEKHDNDQGQEDENEAHKSHLATDPVNDHQTQVGEDHMGQGGQSRGVNVKGFTGVGIGRLIIPEEAPVTARNTPISRHRQDSQPVSHANVEHERTHGEALKEPKKSSYMGKITSILADKATEVKNVVASKLQGVQRVNWADKLRPGDEDRALSQLISGKAGAHHPDAVKGEEQSIPVKERASDAVHKRASENDDNAHNDKEVNLMGRVTESEEVARRLGTSEEERRGYVTNLNPTGKEGPVREWIKETVNSWWSTDGNQHPDSSKSGNSHISKLLYGQSMSPP